jgi:hypothetical protein
MSKSGGAAKMLKTAKILLMALFFCGYFSPLFRYRYFFRSALPLVCNSATDFFTVVHCY